MSRLKSKSAKSSKRVRAGKWGEKSARVLAWFQANPGAKVAIVARRCGVSLPLAYKIRNSLRADAALREQGQQAPEQVEEAPASSPLVVFPEVAVDGSVPVLSSTESLLGARATTHGTFCVTARLSQALKRTLAEHARDVGKDFTDDQWEALEMVATKLARIVSGDPDTREHWDDIAGYATLVSDRLRGIVR